MSAKNQPETPGAGPSGPKDSAPATAPKPEAGKAPAPQDGGGANAGPEKKKPDPTRYGDWEKNGRCIDF